MDLRLRNLPTQVPRKRSRYIRSNKLALQLRTCIFRGSRLYQHSMEDIHHLWRFLFRDGLPDLLHLPGDGA